MARGRLRRGAVIDVGPYRLVYSGEGLRLESERRGRRLEAAGVTCRGRGVRLLDEVSFTAEAGELVAVLGASGSGKSTLLRVLAGLREADAGQVLLDGGVVEREGLFHAAGYVPQDDVLHLDLGAAHTLRYAADLRLQPDLNAEEREGVIASLLEVLGLRSVAGRPLHSLSGGQRKRVSLALELLEDPGLLLLDEPTAGLDASLHRHLLQLFRRLAAEGRTVVLTTHRMESLDLCDRLVVLAGGRLAFSGTPAEARARFGVQDLSRIYDRLPTVTRKEPGPLRRSRRAKPTPRRSTSGFRQWATVTRRGLHLWLADGRRALLLLLQAPLLGLCVAAAVEGPALLLFLLVLTAIWCGTSTAAREVVKERAVLAREQRAGLQRLPYLCAKMTLLAAVGALQCALLLAVVASLRTLPGGLLPIYGALFASAFVAALLGLGVSARAGSPDQASALVPLVLIPQVLLGGVLAGPGDMARVLGRVTPARWGYDLALRASEEGMLFNEVEHRQRLSDVRERRDEIAALGAGLLGSWPRLSPGDPESAEQQLLALERDSQHTAECWVALGDELRGLSERQERTRQQAKVVSQRAAFLQRSLEDLELERGWFQRRVSVAKDLLSSLQDLEVRGENSEGRDLLTRAENLDDALLSIQARQERIRAAWTSAAKTQGDLAAGGQAWRAQAEVLSERALAGFESEGELLKLVQDGRVARFERYGSISVDLLALAALGLAFTALAWSGLSLEED